jgi:hypothetical protein
MGRVLRVGRSARTKWEGPSGRPDRCILEQGGEVEASQLRALGQPRSGKTSCARYALGNRKVSYHSDRRRGEAIKRGPLYIPRAKAKYYLDYSSISRSKRKRIREKGLKSDPQTLSLPLSALALARMHPLPAPNAEIMKRFWYNLEKSLK